jgi:hypothetical protein
MSEEDKMCPYIEKRTIQKTIIEYNEDMQEKGNIQVYEREMMECNHNCMKYDNGKCMYKE